MLRSLLTVILMLGSVPAFEAQNAPAPPSPGYTLRTNARTVLTDVTVTDRAGNPVHNLPQSAFHVFDDNHQEPITSFEEHTGAAVAQQDAGPVGPHTFSNQFLLHPPPAVNIVVLDTWTIDVIDQMYLNEELTHFIQALPSNQLLAIYVFAGENVVLLQNFTADHDLLLTALHKGIPRLPQPGVDRQRASDFAALRQIAQDLSQLPGRKNLLWFSSGAPVLFGTNGTPQLLRSDPTAISPHSLQLVYDLLNSERIAIYPIDARGLEVALAPNNQLALLEAHAGVHLEMRQQADATGGHAYVNTNGLEQAAAHIVATSGDFYTLSYTPPSKLDNKWHKVKVKLDSGDYHLAYRSGYFDDGTLSDPTAKRERTLLRAKGETVPLPANRSEPIIFKVQAQPASQYTSAIMPEEAAPSVPGKNETAYTFRYTVPVSAFNIDKVSAENRVQIGAGVMVFNQYGRVVKRFAQGFTIFFRSADSTSEAKGTISFDQHVNLVKGEDHVDVAVWDLKTGRLGTTQFPLDVKKKAAKH